MIFSPTLSLFLSPLPPLTPSLYPLCKLHLMFILEVAGKQNTSSKKNKIIYLSIYISRISSVHVGSSLCQQRGSRGQSTHLYKHIHKCRNSSNGIHELEYNARVQSTTGRTLLGHIHKTSPKQCVCSVEQMDHPVH